MRIRVGMASVVLPFILVLAAGCSKPEAPKETEPPAPAVVAETEGKALFKKKCGVCHGLDRATARQETKEKWMEIVKSMQGKKADFISDAEAVKIVEFLASGHGKQ